MIVNLKNQKARKQSNHFSINEQKPVPQDASNKKYSQKKNPPIFTFIPSDTFQHLRHYRPDPKEFP
jgi:hypothetical protein